MKKIKIILITLIIVSSTIISGKAYAQNPILEWEKSAKLLALSLTSLTTKDGSPIKVKAYGKDLQLVFKNNADETTDVLTVPLNNLAFYGDDYNFDSTTGAISFKIRKDDRKIKIYNRQEKKYRHVTETETFLVPERESYKYILKTLEYLKINNGLGDADEAILFLKNNIKNASSIFYSNTSSNERFEIKFVDSFIVINIKYNMDNNDVRLSFSLNDLINVFPTESGILLKTSSSYPFKINIYKGSKLIKYKEVPELPIRISNKEMAIKIHNAFVILRQKYSNYSGKHK